MDLPIVISGTEITDYEDEYGNQIIGAPSRTGPQSKVVFKGSNNKIEFGKTPIGTAELPLNKMGVG